MADKNIMSFQDAIRRKKINPWDVVDVSRLFEKTIKEVRASETETGCEEQFFLREDDLKWYCSIDEFGMPTIYGSTTKFKLCLNGISGTNGAITVLQRMACQYSIPLKGILAHPMNKTDVQYLLRDGKKNMLKRVSTEAGWLSTSNIEMCNQDEHPEVGMYYIYNGNLCKVNLYDSKGNHTVKYGFNPVLSIISTSVCVDKEISAKTGTWALVLPK